MRHGMLQESGLTASGTFLLVAQAFEEGLAVPAVHKPGGRVSCLPPGPPGSTHSPSASPAAHLPNSFLTRKTVGTLPKWLFKQGILN